MLDGAIHFLNYNSKKINSKHSCSSQDQYFHFSPVRTEYYNLGKCCKETESRDFLFLFHESA